MWRCAVSLCIVATLTASLRGQGREVVVSAAASLGAVLRQIAPMYESRTGERVVLNVGASNTLARQIAAGAKVDVFISADDAQLDSVKDDVRPGTRVALLSNLLAVVVPRDRAGTVGTVRDLTRPGIRRIAIGDPSMVPVGVYARRYLESASVWNAVRGKIVPSGSVRLALAAVENGVVDAAIVYRSDVAPSSGAHLAFVVPGHEGPPIRYPAAILRQAPNPEGATRFLAFLQTAPATAVFARAGFVPLTAETRGR